MFVISLPDLPGGAARESQYAGLCIEEDVAGCSERVRDFPDLGNLASSCQEFWIRFHFNSSGLSAHHAMKVCIAGGCHQDNGQHVGSRAPLGLSARANLLFWSAIRASRRPASAAAQ